jgi:aminobenzoyl-glutamate utilization protein B
MREHVKGDARIHYVVTNGGGQPKVVPPSSEVWYHIRADGNRDVEDYFDWVSEIARGAAAMPYPAREGAGRRGHARDPAPKSIR